jgi:osmotically-inducible protein OsmY
MNIPKTVIAVGVLAMAVACGPKQPDYEDMANTALDNAGLADVAPDYDQDANVVHLTGTVATDAERRRAEDVVEQAVAPGAMVANEVTVANATSPETNAATAGDMDGSISDRLDTMVDQDQTLENADIDFDVNNGVVTITGNVPTEAARKHVEDMARDVPGVKDVVNSLEVKRS